MFLKFIALPILACFVAVLLWLLFDYNRVFMSMRFRKSGTPAGVHPNNSYANNMRTYWIQIQPAKAEPTLHVVLNEQGQGFVRDVQQKTIQYILIQGYLFAVNRNLAIQNDGRTAAVPLTAQPNTLIVFKTFPTTDNMASVLGAYSGTISVLAWS